MPTLTQTRSFASTPADWSGTATFADFDPGLGTLESIGLSLTASLGSSASFQSGEAAASRVSGGTDGTVTLAAPDGTPLLTALADVSGSVSLAAGSTAGSARTLDGGASATVERNLQPGLAGGGGTVAGATTSLAISATARVIYDGPANLSARFTSNIAASATVSYTYTSGSGASGGSTVSTFGSVPPGNFVTLFSGSVTSAAQTRTVSDQTTGWLTGLTFAGFDPALGRLLAVNVTVAGELVGTIRAQNLDPVAAAVSVGEISTVTLARPDGTGIASTQAQLGLSRTLASSEAAQFADTATSSVADQDTDAADLALFVGAGTVTLPVLSAGASHIDGPGNLATDTAAQAGATVTLSYTYLPGVAGTLTAAPTPTAIGFGETRTVGAGGSTQGEVVGLGGTQLVAAGGTAGDTSVGAAGLQRVAAGGVASGTVVQGGDCAATVQVDAGGSLAGAAVGGFGFAQVAGQSSGTVLSTGGTEIVEAGGEASGTAVGSGGTQEVLGGGRAAGTSVGAGGTVLVDAGGTLDGARIAGGTVRLDAGAAAGGATFAGSRGVLTVGAGAVVGDIGGFAPGDTLDLAGVAFDGTVTATPGEGGVLHVAAAGGGVDLRFDPAAGASGLALRLAPDAAGTGTALTLDPGLAVAGGAGVVSTRAYAGPVEGLQDELASTGAAPVVAAAATDGWFLRGGAGNDALAAHGGTNVLDGGGGSNVLVGASGADGGADTFFTDATGSETVWDTLVNFHAGDSATLWGFDPGVGTWRWDGVSGAEGYTGATLRADAHGTGTTSVSVTFAGLSMAQAQGLQVATGSIAGISYLYLHDPGA